MVWKRFPILKNIQTFLQIQKFSEFFSTDILRKQIEDEFNKKMKKYNPRNIFYDELKENLERKRDEDLILF